MINRFYSWSVRTYLIILLVLLALPSISLIFYSGMAERRQAIADGKAECLKFVNDVAGRQQAMVAGAEQLGTTLSLLPAIQFRNPVAANTLFADLLRNNPQYTNIIVGDRSCFVWASGVPLKGKMYVGDRKHYADALRTGMFSSGEYAIGRATGRPVMMFGYPAKDLAHKVIAVIGITFDLAYVQQAFEKLDLPPGASFSLTDHQGIILTRNLKDPLSAKLVGKRDAREELFTKTTVGPDEGTFEEIGNDGRFRLVAYKRISLAHESKPYLYIRSSIPLTSATSKANAAMFRNLSVFVSLFFIGLFLAWFIAKRMIVNPVMMLKGASERLAAGAHDVNVSRMVKGGELGELARTFDTMAEGLVQRETVLRENEQRWATTLRSIGDAVIATDVDGKITFMNAVAEELTGWILTDASGKPVSEVFDIINEQTRQQTENPVTKVLQEGMIVGLANHTVLVRKDGTEIPIDDSGAPIRDTDGKALGVVLVFRDITKRKQAEEMAQTTLQRFYTVLSSMYTGLLLVTDEGRVEFANQAICDYFDLDDSPQDLVGLMSSEVLAKINRAYLYPDEAIVRVQEIVDRGQPVKNEEVPMRSGRELLRDFIPIQVHGRSYGRLWYHTDITERKRAEEEIRKSRDEMEIRVRERTAELIQKEETLRTVSAYNRSLLEASVDPLVTIDRDGKIKDVNTATETSTGYNRETLIGTDFTDYFTDPEKARAGYELVFKEGQVHDYALEIRHRDGHTTPVLYNASVYKDAAGEVAGVFAAARDITEQRRLEEQLRQSHKMEAIGTLAGGIAHDFNNILAAILGFTEMAVEDAADRPEVGKSLQNVLKSAMRARELVKQILAFSRKTNYERTPLSLSPLIKETIQLLRASIPATIEIRHTIIATSDTILVSPVEVQQILMNLATNASLAMQEKGGTLEISLTDIDFTPDSAVSEPNVMPGEYVQLIVKDTGTGMSRDVMKRVFEPFYTTRGVGKGTGMGLAVVYGIVKDLQGAITVESEPGVGSTFRVVLPKVRTEGKDEYPHSTQIPTGTEKILFVDDEELLAKWGQMALERLGYKVTSETDSKEALKLFSSGLSRFDLVITDHTMPGLTGLQFAKELLKIQSDVPIILCTGHSETISPEIAREAGIREYLMKPLARQELAQAVRRILDETA